MIKSIFFDLDNTLWDFNASADLALNMVYEQHLRALSIDQYTWRQVYNRHNNELWNLYRQALVTSEQVKIERFRRSFAELGAAHLPASEIAPAFLQGVVEKTVLFPDVVETLTALSRAYTLGVITNGFAASERRLTTLGLDKLFCTLITSEAIGVPKPQPAMFLHALSIVDCRPEEFVYVGDDYSTDIVGAKSAGVRAVLFNHKREDVADKVPKPDAVIDTFTQLMDLFPIG